MDSCLLLRWSVFPLVRLGFLFDGWFGMFPWSLLQCRIKSEYICSLPDKLPCVGPSRRNLCAAPTVLAWA